MLKIENRRHQEELRLYFDRRSVSVPNPLIREQFRFGTLNCHSTLQISLDRTKQAFWEAVHSR